jgi:ribosomal protein S27AE
MPRRNPDYETTVTTWRVRCPWCGSDSHRHVRSEGDQGDGSVRIKKRCTTCGRGFAVVVEDDLPGNGQYETGGR